MTDPLADPFGNGPTPSWDDDASWVNEAEDHSVEFDLPPDVLAELLEHLGAGGPTLDPEVLVMIQDGDGERELGSAEISELVATASTSCSELLGTGGCDDDRVIELASAASILATLWTFNFEATEWDAAAAMHSERRWVDALGKLAADCGEMLNSRFRRRADGTFTLRWRPMDAELMRNAIDDLRGLVAGDDPSIARLFPSAYGGDEERNAGWDALARGELIEHRLAAFAVVDDLLGRSRCTVDELNAFMRALNDVRLVLGTRLDVDESGPPPDMSPDDRSAYTVYEYLTIMLGQAIRALRRSL